MPLVIVYFAMPVCCCDIVTIIAWQNIYGVFVYAIWGKRLLITVIGIVYYEISKNNTADLNKMVEDRDQNPK